MEDVCVIGSGPAAVAAAYALTNANRRVVMLDGGVELDSSRRAVVDRMSDISPQDWSDADLRTVKEGIAPVSREVPTRRLFGSDFPFETAGTGYSHSSAGVDVRPSFARGGLSNVWGAGVLPFHPDDTKDWPITATEMESHYRAILSFIPATGYEKDAIAELLPDFSSNSQQLPASSQGFGILQDAAARRESLKRRGIFVGRARLAVDAGGKSHGRRPCERCGLCLYGCPYNLIYNSAFSLAKLQQRKNFEYRPGFIVRRLEESGAGVLITGNDRQTQNPLSLNATRVMLGAGVLSTTKIMLESLGEIDVPIHLQDSYYFLMPMLRVRSSARLEAEAMTTLAQAFVLISDRRVDEQLVHLSVYGYNDLMIRSLRAAAGRLGQWNLGGFANGLWKSLASRTLVLGGYLHSKSSPGIWMNLQRTPDGGATVRLEAESDARARATAVKVAGKLLRAAFDLQAFAIPFAMQFPPSGRGFHIGGSFPMSVSGGSRTSDTAGVPHGFNRVHLIDASTFPTVPATTITLAVMANAHRIASLAAERA